MKTAALFFAVWASLGVVPGAFAWDILPAFGAPKIPAAVLEAHKKKEQDKADHEHAAKENARYRADITEARAKNLPKSGQMTTGRVPPPVYPKRTSVDLKVKPKK